MIRAVIVRIGPPASPPPRPDWLVADASRCKAAASAAEVEARWLHGIVAWIGPRPRDDGERDLLIAREVATDAAACMGKLR